MTILPLLERELRVRARSAAGYWTRCGAALAGMLVCLSTLTVYAGTASNVAELGAFAFKCLVVSAFTVCCLCGFLTVDGISRERREGTLGLLFLTRVRTLDVLLGNFGAEGLASLCALAAFAPVLIVPMLAGGVSGAEAARTVLVLFDTMILSLADGLWASASGRGWWWSAFSAAALLALIIFGPPGLGSLFPQFLPLDLSWPGPLSALASADDTHYQQNVATYWIALAVVHGISWLLVVDAGKRLRRALEEDNEAPANAFGRARRRHPLAAGEAPLEWLMRRQRGVGAVVWTGALLGSAYYGSAYFSRFPFFGRFTSGISGGYSLWDLSLAFSVVEGCFFAWVASRFLIEARRTGELELLLTTPEGARTIVASQWRWLKGVFRWPLAVVVAPTMGLSLIPTPGISYRLYYVAFHLLSCLITLLGIVALLWAGMWFGWYARSQARAIVRVVLVARIMPYVVGYLAYVVLNKFAPMTLAWSILLWGMPQIVNLVFYMCLFQWARRRLASQLPQAGRG